MDTLVFSTSTKKESTNFSSQGFGNKPPERQKQVRQQTGRTSLFGNDADPTATQSPTKPRTHNRNASNIGFGGDNQNVEAERPSRRTLSQAPSFNIMNPGASGEDGHTEPAPRRKGGNVGQANKNTWQIAVQEGQPRDIDPTKPNVINTSTRKHHHRASSSMGMTRLLANPQESTPAKNQTSKFIANSGVPMEKLSDLDRKSKHAFMKTQSNVFANSLPATSSQGNVVMARKGGRSGNRGQMGGLMHHDEGPYAKMDWPSKRGGVSDKPSQSDAKKVKRQTFIRVMSDKKEPRRTREVEGKSQVF